MKILIKGGRVIDPANGVDGVFDILVEAGRIAQVAKNIADSGAEQINAKNAIVIPGLVDMHVHLREPGREDKETVRSGTHAAVKGGITSVVAMPNTSPAMDSLDNLMVLQKIIRDTALANVYIAGAITKGRLGEELTDIAGLKKSGAIAVTDDGCSVEADHIMAQAFALAQKNDLLVMVHCEDKKLSSGGVVNRGLTATRMGLRGISNESEYARIARDIDLARKAGARIHISHVSCKESVDIIAQAKQQGVRVTAETAPHYFALDESAVIGYDTNKKMNPPLRSRQDKEAVKEGLRSGVLDAIASDHAPHTDNEKEIEFDRAEFGVTGLETELAVGITELVETGFLSLSELVTKLTVNPARILGIDKGTLAVGKDADIAVVDLASEWMVSKDAFVSLSKNSAFIGARVRGQVLCTLCQGRIVYIRGE